jgi:hypothetical protein
LNGFHEFENGQFLRVGYSIRLKGDAQLLELFSGENNIVFVHPVIKIPWFIQTYEISICLNNGIEKLFIPGYQPFQLPNQARFKI